MIILQGRALFIDSWFHFRRTWFQTEASSCSNFSSKEASTFNAFFCRGALEATPPPWAATLALRPLGAIARPTMPTSEGCKHLSENGYGGVIGGFCTSRFGPIFELSQLEPGRNPKPKLDLRPEALINVRLPETLLRNIR